MRRKNLIEKKGKITRVVETWNEKRIRTCQPKRLLRMKYRWQSEALIRPNLPPSQLLNATFYFECKMKMKPVKK